MQVHMTCWHQMLQHSLGVAQSSLSALLPCHIITKACQLLGEWLVLPNAGTFLFLGGKNTFLSCMSFEVLHWNGTIAVTHKSIIQVYFFFSFFTLQAGNLLVCPMIVSGGLEHLFGSSFISSPQNPCGIVES